MSSKTAPTSTFNPNNRAPPAYDTLSIAPPSVEQSNFVSPPGRVSTSNSDPESSIRRESSSSKWKQKWQELKDEDERRKSERIQHVSPQEADRITGLDKHRVLEEKKSAERKRGGKTILGILALS